MLGLPTQEEAMNVAQSAPQRDSLPRERYLFAPLSYDTPTPARSPINIFTPGALIWQLAREMKNCIELVNEAILSKPCIKLIGNFVCPSDMPRLSSMS